MDADRVQRLGALVGIGIASQVGLIVLVFSFSKVC